MRGAGRANSRATSSGSPRITSAVFWTWSKRTRMSATRKRLSGRPVLSAGSSTVAPRRGTPPGPPQPSRVVVGEVADDGFATGFGLGEVTEMGAGADERVAAE